MRNKKVKSFSIGIIHPDLGLGGAERLIVDIALELRKFGHEIYLYTSHHDVDRCFEDTLSSNGRRQGWILLRGTWIPRHVFGFCHVFFANLRCFWLTLAMLLMRKRTHIQLLIVDQVSLPVAIVQILTNIRTIFYCHYPDLLLSTRKTKLRRIYRLPFDLLEKYSTLMANKIIVNSEFTAQVFLNTLNISPSESPDVLYPTVSIMKVNNYLKLKEKKLFSSINRFERKKDLFLALHAYVYLKCLLKNSEVNKSQLIIAGGYDSRINENVHYLKELIREAKRLSIRKEISFLTSINSEQKRKILFHSTSLLYTPNNEHFGIVPIEAMSARTPVIACDSGGPRETVLNDKTGFLCKPNSLEFAKSMYIFCMNPLKVKEFGSNGKQRVESLFERSIFGSKLSSIISEMME